MGIVIILTRHSVQDSHQRSFKLPKGSTCTRWTHGTTHAGKWLTSIQQAPWALAAGSSGACKERAYVGMVG